MRKITRIVIHCSATREGQDHDVEDIWRWHKQRGFRDVGYHYVVRLDGTVERGRPEEQPGAHVAGRDPVTGVRFNDDSIGICYIGGVAANGVTPKDTRTAEQKVALRRLVGTLRLKYPEAVVVGHRDLSPDTDKDGKVEPHEWLKACPSFDVRTQL